MKTRKQEAPSTQRRKALGNWRDKEAVSGKALSSQHSAVRGSLKTSPAQRPEEPEKPKRRRQGKFTLKDLNYPDQRVGGFRW